MNCRRIIFGGHAVVCAVLAVAALLCAGVDSSIAAPSVSSVSGTVSNGQSITITGSSFGSGPNVILFDDFSQGTSGSTISLTGPEVGSYYSLEGAPKPVYSSAQSHHSPNSLYCYTTGSTGSPDNWACRTNIALTSGTQVFVSWWMYISGTMSENFKTMWAEQGLDNSTSGDLSGPVWGISGAQYGTGVYGSNALDFADWGINGGPTLTAGTWTRFWHLLDSTTANYILTWQIVPGKGVVQVSSAAAGPYSGGGWYGGTPWTYLQIPAYEGDSNANTQATYIADLYVATGPNAMARVEIGNASTYNACTNLTIVTPTAWNASSITATVRQGSFGSSGSAYLYVLDATGTPNANGYPVSFGGGSTAPPAPSGLHLEE